MGVAQLVAQRSPKPKDAGSSPATHASQTLSAKGESLNGRGDDSAGCLFEGSETIVSEAISGESEILLQPTMGQCK